MSVRSHDGHTASGDAFRGTLSTGDVILLLFEVPVMTRCLTWQYIVYLMAESVSIQRRKGYIHYTL